MKHRLLFGIYGLLLGALFFANRALASGLANQEGRGNGKASAAPSLGRAVECRFIQPPGALMGANYECSLELLQRSHYRRVAICHGTTACLLNLSSLPSQLVRIWSPDSSVQLVTNFQNVPAMVRFPVFPRAARVTKGPWIGDVLETSAVVRWETDRYAGSWLRIVNALNQVPHDARWIQGTSTCSSPASPTPCLHTAQVARLQSAHRYEFLIGDGLSNPKKLVHATGAVDTAPGATANFTFSTFADVQGGGTFADISAYAPTPAHAGPVIQTGDMVESAAGWPDFFAWGSPVLSRRPFYPALGNNDPQASFLDFFAFPSNSSKKTYRSFDYANTHFILLDSNSTFGPQDPQVVWLKNDLTSAANTMANIVIALHYGPYGYGVYNDNGNFRALLQSLATTPSYQNAFGKIRLVLSGHQHYYERIVKQYSTGGGNRSIRYLTLGSAGVAPRCPGTGADLEKSSACVGGSKHYQFATIEVRDTTIEGRVYNFQYDGAGNPILVPISGGGTSRYSLLDCFAFDANGNGVPLATPCVI